jgi:hypothetical protein
MPYGYQRVGKGNFPAIIIVITTDLKSIFLLEGVDDEKKQNLDDRAIRYDPAGILFDGP